jgi:uncharacterized protein related to proFAR isomerase
MVDADGDKRLSRDEMGHLKEFVKVAYGKDLDLAVLDTDASGTVSLTEFVNLFKKS